MTEGSDIDAIREFFADLPDEAFVGERTNAGRSLDSTYGNPDIPSGPHRRKMFPDPESLDAFLTDTGLDSDKGSEYVFIAYMPDGTCILYIQD